ncbi:hypothetical protein [Halioxenophilus sp. WMMB6]|uniref:hypothetical protein n=1 Tax=Halioxenophilus sp. WMMB6 TaxID=3073815 RepID=UPI00295E3AE1|nr:hypothetical protein [Halioxenophilus sp. WMMB6]
MAVEKKVRSPARKPGLWSALLLTLAAAGAASAASADSPKMADYPATPVAGTLQTIDMNSDPDAGMFKTRLGYLIGEPANFAGDNVLTFWGCGTGCQMLAMVNLPTGKVTVFSEELIASNGYCYRADSRLLMVNPLEEYMEPEDAYYFKTGFYLWDGSQFKLLAETAPVHPDGPCDIGE